MNKAPKSICYKHLSHCIHKVVNVVAQKNKEIYDDVFLKSLNVSQTKAPLVKIEN